MTDLTLKPHRSKSALPSWARLDHPIVIHELKALPSFNFLGRGSLADGFVALLVITLLLTPCACFCFNGPAQFILAALGWLPLIWGAPVISREIETRTWETLRVTPYSAGEIVLAKLSAVIYQLSPSLGALLAGQAAPLLALGLSIIFPIYGLSFFSANMFTQPQMITFDPQHSIASLAGWMLLAILSLAGVLLDYLTNAVLGVLASLLARSRNTAYATAFGLRLALTLGLLLLATLIASAATGVSQSPFGLLLGSAIVGAPGWALFVAQYQVLPAALIALVMFAVQGSALAILLGGLIWQAERVEQF